jgi:hypothetical protein
VSQEDSRQETFGDEFISEITAQLRANSWVRCKLPGGGRLHIDRRLPFLCVYRRPPGWSDVGTNKLLLGEASYLLASGEPEQQQGISATATFRVVAPHRDAPMRLLEKLENALLGVAIDGVSPTVAVSYEKLWAPPGLEPLSLQSHVGEANCLKLGLEIEPFYRDAATGALFPFELDSLRQALGRALKRVFYSFSLTLTSHRPAHYYELGRHAMTTAVWETDRALAEISDDFDILLHVTPVNVGAAWEEFQRHKHAQEPEFHYRSRPMNPALLKRQLYQIPLERIEDPTLAHIFATKRDELDRQITLIGDRGTPSFLHGSQQLYGEIGESLLEQAKGLLEQLPPHNDEEQQTPWLDADTFVKEAQAELARYREQDADFSARVELRQDVTGMLVSKGDLLVGPDLRVAETRLAAALSHEVGTHIGHPLQWLQAAVSTTPCRNGEL